MSELPFPQIEKMIYIIRGQKVMIDSDLAVLYGVETKNLNKQVQRNLNRFPEDFMFKLSTEEFELIKFQIESFKEGRGGRRHLPLVFTEPGIAMLSSVLTSERAALMNVSIMRTFIKLRSFLALEDSLPQRVTQLEQGTNKLFKVVFERLNEIEEKNSETVDVPVRRKIGLQVNKKL